jgi:hypothetical protein
MIEEIQSEKDKKKKVVDVHIDSLNVQIGEKIATKSVAEKLKIKVDDIIVELDKDISQSQQEVDFLTEFQDKIIDLDNTNWGTYLSLAEHQERSEPTAKNLFIDIKKVTTEIIPLGSAIISGGASTCSNYFGVYDLVKKNYSGDSEFLKEVSKYSPTDDFWNNVEIIKQEMNRKISGSGDNFEKAVRRFTTETNKSPVLLEIRSCIWEQFFDKIIPNESQYRKTNWYKTCSRKEHYCQTRLLIQGTIDVPIPSATNTEIDRLSFEMNRLFHELSEGGKLGENQSYAEYLVKTELVPTFKSVLTYNV